jgi:hypothetical protein
MVNSILCSATINEPEVQICMPLRFFVPNNAGATMVSQGGSLMKDIEVVQRALEIAQHNGWNMLHSSSARVFKDDSGLRIRFLVKADAPSLVVDFEKLLFSHDFAESFFGMDTMYFVVDIDHGPGAEDITIGWKSEEELQRHDDTWRYYDNAPAFEYHLQQLSLLPSQKERVQYLENIIEEMDTRYKNAEEQLQ